MHRKIMPLLLVAMAIGATFIALSPTRAAAPSSPYSWFEPLVDIERIIEDRYVEAPDLEAMQTGAIEGMIEALDDPYTEFIPNKFIADFDKSVRGRYVGIGAAVNMEDGEVTIVTPLDDSPAFEAGLMSGDKIIAVDGEPTTGIPINATIDMLVGEPGTQVMVTIRRGPDTFDVPIIRRQIVTRTVSGWKRIGEDWDFMIDPEHKIGYARISQFNATTPRELREALDRLRENGMEAFVLDLRFNPGGLFAAATQMADFFLESGLIVKTRGRAHPEQPMYATRQGTLPEFPIAVLINQQSASASEVLAGALRDNDRAIIVGSRSFGKGVMQSVLALPSGAGQLKVTEQYYYGPSGRKIQRDDDSTTWGVDPTDGFLVTMSNEAYGDMLRIQRDNAIIRDVQDAGPTAGIGADWIEIDLADAQLAAAVRGLIGKLETGEYTTATDADVADTIELQELERLQSARERLTRDMERLQRRIAALSSVAPEDQLPDPEQIVPEGVSLNGGVIELRNADGEVVSRLRITGDGVERWLVDAPVEIETSETLEPASAPD